MDLLHYQIEKFCLLFNLTNLQRLVMLHQLLYYCFLFACAVWYNISVYCWIWTNIDASILFASSDSIADGPALHWNVSTFTLFPKAFWKSPFPKPITTCAWFMFGKYPSLNIFTPACYWANIDCVVIAVSVADNIIAAISRTIIVVVFCCLPTFVDLSILLIPLWFGKLNIIAGKYAMYEDYGQIWMSFLQLAFLQTSSIWYTCNIISICA